MTKGEVMKSAVSSTAAPEAGETDMSGVLPETEEEIEEDGTVTIPLGILPAETKEGDIVRFEYVTETEDGCVLKPVIAEVKKVNKEEGKQTM